MFLIVGVGFLVTGIVMVRKLRNLPQRILREGNMIDFDKGIICTADKIEDVTYQEYKTRSSSRPRIMHKYSYGTLTVYVDGKVLTYEFIANVKAAHDRLIQLKEDKI